MARRPPRHHDGGVDAKQAGSRRDALGVVAGREGDNARAAPAVVELHEAVVGAANLE
jgi:hypothetical protein